MFYRIVILVLDGVYRGTEGVSVFHAVRAPTAAELLALLSRIIKRLMRLLTRKGCLIGEQGMTYLTDTDPDTALGPLQSAACTYRIALGPRAGHNGEYKGPGLDIVFAENISTLSPLITLILCAQRETLGYILLAL